jgi:hypothetical protein
MSSGIMLSSMEEHRGGLEVPQTVDRKTVHSWSRELNALRELIAPRFARSEVQHRAQAYLRGSLDPFGPDQSLRHESRRCVA